MDDRERLVPQIKKVADRYSLNPKLVEAIAFVESTFNQWAIRFEPKSRSNVIPHKFATINLTTDITEETGQKFSWGLLQIMGSTARWMGYHGPLPLLCDVDTNLIWGCRYLSKLKDDFGVTENMIAAYNAGCVRRNQDGKFVNQAYVDKVLKAMNP